jgi:hypothetical protein
MTNENEVGKTREKEGTTESSREVSQCGNSEPGTASGTGREENDIKMAGTDPAGPETDQAKTAIEPERTASGLIERATALRGLSIGRPRTPKSTLRRRSLQDIRSRDPEVPYQLFEGAARDLVCSLMERQDRMNEEIFNKLVDLEYRINDIEQDMIELNDKRRS